MSTPKPGTITWCDLTVANADKVRDFYRAVARWKVMPVDMGGYDDYCMLPPKSKQPVGGICHKRGENADLPSQWLVYINVANLAASLRAVKKNGGKILRPARSMGGGRMAVVQDPAGAVAALFQHPKK